MAKKTIKALIRSYILDNYDNRLIVIVIIIIIIIGCNRITAYSFEIFILWHFCFQELDSLDKTLFDPCLTNKKELVQFRTLLTDACFIK
ncbi:hypothetical protein DERF_003267 [Dermatophagoides farinae]|uniref:Uncharacterized protein n=1 Tax=Dermatophagoides farinae TaxID=6954 RepID=A0A922IFQ6_DERFA|nr:hypothetical protein DERF_003267 [Dermatophagoides farinae]